MNTLIVDAAEHGLKLIRFLARRLAMQQVATRQTNGVPLLPVSQTMLHRWIRTGQVRVNSARSAPFALLSAGDIVRLPPFALSPENNARTDRPQAGPQLFAGQDIGGGLRILALTPQVLVLEKPAGLPTQPGSKHDDSVVHRLRTLFAGRPYLPAPAHRLDKACSGIVLAGRTHAAQQYLHTVFAGASEGPEPGKTAGLEKIYLAWVKGVWPHAEAVVLRDYLAKVTTVSPARPGRELVRSVSGDEGRLAVCEATLLTGPVQIAGGPAGGPASLLRISLHTGRTHQIRAQLAERGHPIIGDTKYGGASWPYVLLHAHQLSVPANDAGFAALTATSWPDHWSRPFAVATALLPSADVRKPLPPDHIP